jgi:hypothetical protein
MSSHFTKEETRAMFKEFLYVIGNDLPDGQIKAAWERFCTVKREARWKAELDAMVEEGLLEAVQDPQTGECHYSLTEKGLASRKRGQLERLGA